MKIQESKKIIGLKVITPNIYTDRRGEFLEALNTNVLSNLNLNNINQTMISTSHYGVLRGLHYQVHEPLTQIIQCIKGEVLDFAIDLRKNSETFNNIFLRKISDIKKNIIFLPPGLAHGYLSLSKKTIILYHIYGKYIKKFERGVNYNSLNLKLPFDPKVVNKRDKNWPGIDKAEIYEDL